jgi:flagellar biogenesis protein FliO
MKLKFLLVAAMSSEAAHAQVSQPSLPQYGDALIRMLVSLAAVVAALLGAAYLLKRAKGTRPAGDPGVLRVIASRQLAAGQSVHLLRVGSQFILVGSSPNSIHPLTETTLDDEALVALITKPPAGGADAPGPVPFIDRLRRSRGKDAAPQGTTE